MASDYIMHYEKPDLDIYEEYLVNRDQQNAKRSKRPRYFPSNRPQAFIKNAVTGVPYPYVVGSKEQLLLYKIVDTTGTCDPEGYVIKDRSDLPNHHTNHLFYDSPEQCMSHLRLSLNPADVKRWHDNHTERMDSVEES
jgi:hypothetical protein